MTFDHDQDYYSELVGSFDEWEGWSRDENESEEVIDIADEGASHLSHYNRETGAIFWLDINGDEYHVATGELHQPISVIHYLEGEQGAMSPYIARDHFDIVKDELEKHESVYLEPVEHPARVLSLKLPFHYEKEKLEEDLETITEISEQIFRLHRDEYDNWLGY